ncbi:MAG: virulence factor Mce family protein [Mycobacterium sp.]
MGRPAATSKSGWAASPIPARGGALLPSEANRRQDRDPLRTGIFGLTLVICIVLVAFGYTGLPFWPHGRPYSAYFTDAGGITPGNDVYVSGIKVGQVTSVGLAGDTAKVGFTVDRHIAVGNQSLASIRTDTILGERSIAVTPAGSGITTTIPLSRTTTPYALNSALQDLGGNAADLDKDEFEKSLQVLTDALQDATPQLRGALDGVTSLSRTLNRRDEALGSLLAHAKSVTEVLADRAGQVNKLVLDGNQLFAALDARRAALAQLIAGIDDVSQQLSGFVADNRKEFGPALSKLNLVLDTLTERHEYISEALKRLPAYATTLGEVVGSGPGFNVNVYGVLPAPIVGIMFDAVFQPGKLPDSFADYLRGLIQERWIIRPQSP